MGQVYLYLHVYEPEHYRTIAVKQINASSWKDLSFRRSFRNEWKMMSAVQSTRVVQFHSLQQIDERQSIVMEYVHGCNLRELITKAKSSRKPLGIGIVVHLMRELLSALHDLHRTRGPNRQLFGIVHRDIKPANILLAEDGGMKLADFGVARARNASEGGLTRGQGSPDYLPPEARGVVVPTPQMDLYSAGLVLFELLTGEVYLHWLPTKPNSQADPGTEADPIPEAERVQLLRDKLQALAVPTELVQLLLALTHTEPAHRPVSAQVALESIYSIQLHASVRDDLATRVRTLAPNEIHAAIRSAHASILQGNTRQYPEAADAPSEEPRVLLPAAAIVDEVEEIPVSPDVPDTQNIADLKLQELDGSKEPPKNAMQRRQWGLPVLISLGLAGAAALLLRCQGFSQSPRVTVSSQVMGSSAEPETTKALDPRTSAKLIAHVAENKGLKNPRLQHLPGREPLESPSSSAFPAKRLATDPRAFAPARNGQVPNAIVPAGLTPVAPGADTSQKPIPTPRKTPASTNPTAPPPKTPALSKAQNQKGAVTDQPPKQVTVPPTRQKDPTWQSSSPAKTSGAELRTWCRKIYTPYRRQFASRFPFSSSAKRQVKLEQFSQFFHPTRGSLWRSLSGLRPLILQDGNRFRATGPSRSKAVQVNPQVLVFFRNAWILANSMFPGESLEPSVSFSVSIAPGQKDRNLTLELGSTVLSSSFANKSTGLVWPRNTGQTAVLSAHVQRHDPGVTKLVHRGQQGPFALFSLLKSAKVVADDGISFRVAWRGPDQSIPATELDFRLGSRNSPFFGTSFASKGFLRAFHLRLPDHFFVGGVTCEELM